MFEKLEDRVMPLALVSLTMRLDEGQLEVGDQIIATIYARELNPATPGLAGVSVDVLYDPTMLRAESFEITDHLPYYQMGTIDNDVGTVDNISGYFLRFPQEDLGGRPIGNLRPELFAEIVFTAIGNGDTIIDIHEGRSGVGTIPVMNLNDGSGIESEGAEITVVAKEVIPPIENPPILIVVPPNDPPQDDDPLEPPIKDDPVDMPEGEAAYGPKTEAFDWSTYYPDDFVGPIPILGG